MARSPSSESVGVIDAAQHRETRDVVCRLICSSGVQCPTMATRTIALLRGINVGRNKRVAMADLRALLADLGYTDVQTLLQSGNAVFTAPRQSDTLLATTIEQALIQKLAVESRVIVRTSAELAAVLAANPLCDIATDPARYLVGFCAEEPDEQTVQAVAALDVDPDQVRLIGRELYLWYANGVLDSRLSKIAWLQKVGGAMTARNWNTVTKLAAMAGE